MNELQIFNSVEFGTICNPKIEIKSINGTTHIFIDGTEIHGVRGMKLEQSIETFPILSLDLNALDLDIEVSGLINIKGLEDFDIKPKKS